MDRWWDDTEEIAPAGTAAAITDTGDTATDDGGGEWWKQAEPLNLEQSLTALYREEARPQIQASGLPNVTAGLMRASAGVFAPVLRGLGNKTEAIRLQARAAAGEQAAEELAREKTSLPIVPRTLRGVVATLPAGLIGGRIAGPYGALGAGGLSQYDASLFEAKQAGLSDKAALQYAKEQGVLEFGVGAVMQKIGLGGLESVLGNEPGQAAVKQGLRQGLWNFVKETGAELGEEHLTELSQAVDAKLRNVDPNALTPAALQQLVADTTAQTVLAMGAAEGLRQLPSPEQQQSEDNGLRERGDKIEAEYRAAQQQRGQGQQQGQQPPVQPTPEQPPPAVPPTDVLQPPGEFVKKGLQKRTPPAMPPPDEGVQPSPSTTTPPPAKGTWDFTETFPQPTEAAQRELQPGQHFPEPTDTEAVRSHFDETAREYSNLRSDAAAARDVAASIRSTGMSPNGRKLKDPEREARQLEQAAANDEDRAEGIIAQTADIYGFDAADAFRTFAEKPPPPTSEVVPPTKEFVPPPAAAEPQPAAPSKKSIGKKKPSSATTPAPEQWRSVGTNSKGQELFEDENGVRSYVENGIRVTEPVAIIPGRGISVDRTQPDYKTAEELAAEAKPAAPTGEVIESPNLKTARRREEDAAARHEIAKNFQPGQRVRQPSTGRLGTFQGTGTSGTVGVKWDDGSSISGMDPGQIEPAAEAGEAKPPATETPVRNVAPEMRSAAPAPSTTDLDALADQIWDEETAPPPQKSIGKKQPKPQATTSGQFVMPFPGMREDANRGEFLAKHRRPLLDEIEFQHGPELAAQALKPISQGLAAVYDAPADKLDSFVDEMWDSDWMGAIPSDIDTGGAIYEPLLREFQQAVRERRAALADQAATQMEKSEKAEKKSLGKPKTKIQEKAGSARSAGAAARKAFIDAVRDSVRNPKLTTGGNADLMRLAVKAAIGTVNEGVWTFAEYVETIYNEAPDLIDTLAPYLEAAWRVAKKRDTTGQVSESGRVADVLPDILAKGGSNAAEEGSGGPEAPVAGTRRPGAGVGERPDEADDGVLEGQPPEDVRAPSAAGDVGGPGEGGGDALHQPGTRSDQPGNAGGRRQPRVRGRAADDTGERGPGDAGEPAAGGAGGDVPVTRGRPNYHLTEPEKIVGGGPKEKFRRNQRAIELAQQIPLQNREPTTEELDILASYTGWGAFGQELFQGSWEHPKPKSDWQDESEWLRETLGEEEWKSAQNSIINAHYTDPQTVTAMWDMARRLGFTGGRVLEPSMGVGNFFSLMPRDLMENSQLTGIELDSVAGGMAKLLHPNANIQIKGYEESRTPDDFYDLAITNVPFANIKPADRRYEKFQASLHNFFFLKAMDQVKPGGLVMFLTSNMTMDGKANAARVRSHLEDQADLVAAFRFPAGAFQKYAGTKVVADLIILRKRREGEKSQSKAWQNVAPVPTPSGKPVEVNEYWADNPQHVFGTLNHGHGTTTGRPGMVVDRPADLESLVQKAIKALPAGIVNTTPQTADAGKLRANDTQQRQNTVVVRGGDVLIVRGEHLVPLQEVVKWKQARWTAGTASKRTAEIASLTKVREVLGRLFDAQRTSQDTAELRKALSAEYDRFVQKHGYITQSQAAKVLTKAGDPLGNALVGLESKTADGSYEKRPVFTRPTTRTKHKTKNLSVGDAYAVQRNESLDLNVERIAELSNKTPAEVIAELGKTETIYKTAADNYQAADIFMSGNVRRKAREIEAAMAEGVTGLERSLAAIKAVIPEDVPYTDIEVNIGATWVPASDYAAFLGNLLAADTGEFTVERRTNGWRVHPGAAPFSKPEADVWGHPQVAFNKLLEAAMNNAPLRVFARDAEGNPVFDEVGTREANEKADAIREEFRNWIWTSQDRVGRLSSAYNEAFNAYATPEYSGAHLSFEGLALEMGDDPFSFRQHQANAVWRGLVTGKGLYAHEVGTGKTFTMAGLAIESRRLGLASKPLLLAHNANSLGVYNDIQRAYPAAKILYVDNLDAASRDRTLAQIALDEWDLVVMPHSLIDRLELRAESIELMVRDEIAALDAAAHEALAEDTSGFGGSLPADLNNITEDDLKKLRNRTAKELVKERMRLRARVVAAAQAAQNANTVFFEDMGVDMMMVDEAHIFKKLPISTKQQIKGLNKAGSERGTSMMLLANYLRMNNNGRGVHLFTGTPITNTLNEIYNMQRLLMAEEMDRDGIKSWDGWFNNFGRSVSDVELSSGGTWEPVERLAAFINIPELRQVIGQYLDTVFADDMPEFKLRDSRDGLTESPIGRPYREVHLDIGEMTPEQAAVAQDLRERYTEFKKARGKEKRAMMFTKTHNPLNIEGEGVKNALDPRFSNQAADSSDPNLKINRMMKNAMAYYHEHPKAAQMIFMQTGFNDTATRTVSNGPGMPPTVTTERVFNLAKDIKQRLIAAGVPVEQIAIFSDLSKEKRAEAADAMQKGQIRFAIGSTETMGTGVNAQNYLVAMHHLDAPWMPGDLEQRNGRGWRQGNRWNTVHEHRYLTEGSHDGRRWQILLTKSRFIEAFMRNKDTGRTLEGDATNVDETGGSEFEETFAGAAGDPRILIRTKLEKDVEKLERAQSRHASNVQNTLYDVSRQEQKLPDYQKYREGLKSDLETVKANQSDDFRMQIGNTTYVDRKEAKDALAKAFELHSKPRETVHVGTFSGFKLAIVDKYMKVIGVNQYDVNPNPQSIEAILRNLPSRLPPVDKKIAEMETFIASGRELAKRPFPRADDLEKKKAKLAAIVAEMSANPTPSPAWLRQGVPTGTSVYYRGKEYAVAGHRGDDMVLLDGPNGIIAAPHLELTDQYGTWIFPGERKPVAAGAVHRPGELVRGARPGRSRQRGRRRLGFDESGDGIQAMAARTGAAGSGTGRIRSSPGAPRIPAGMEPGGPKISAQEIIKTISELFGLPIRSGRVALRKALGIYKQRPEVVRTKGQSSGDLAVISHELAHHLDKTTSIRKELAVTKPMKNELRALDYEPQKRRLDEGFAEFMRLYLTNDGADARAAAPKYYDYLTQNWLPKHPEIAQKLARARDLIEQWRKQGAASRVESAISETGVAPGPVKTLPESLRDTVRAGWQQAMRTVFDESYVLKQADQALRDKGGLQPGDTPMADLYAVLSRASPGMAERAITEGVYTIDGHRVGGSLQQALKDISEEDAAEFRRFLYSRHALEVYDKKPKMNPGVAKEDAQYVVDEVSRDRTKLDRFTEAADAVTSYARSLLEVMVDAGVITPESAEKMRNTWETYVPLSRAMDAKSAVRALGPQGGGLIDITSPIMKRRGSGRQVIDPLAMLVRQTQHFYNVAARKYVEREFIRHFDPALGGTQGMGEWLERVPANRVPTKVNLAEIWPAIVKALEEKGLTEELGFDADMLRDLGDVFIQDFANIWRPDYSPVPGQYISRVVLADGKPVLYQWDADLYEAVKGQSPVQLPWFARLFATGVSALKLGATELNPAFAGANVARDWWTLQHQSQYLGPLEALWRPFFEIITYSLSELAEHGLLPGRQPDEVVKLWKRAGGKLATRYGMDQQGIKNMRRQALGLKRHRTLRENLILPVQTLREVINVSEVGPRLAEFVAALKTEGYERKNGKIVDSATGQAVDDVPLPSLVKAMRAAQVVTVDFGQRGTGGKWVDQFVPFFNAALQGTYALGQNLGRAGSGAAKLSRGEPLSRGEKRILIALASSAAATVAYYLVRGDDDDYKDEEDWLKYGHWTFTDNDGKPILKIPKGYEYSLVPNMTEAILDAATKGKGESLRDAMYHEARNRIPFNGPAVVTPALEAWANYDTFREKPIENQRMQQLRPGDRATPYNTELMKAIGNWLNVSPAKMEHVTDAVTGGGYRRIYGTAERLAEGRPEPADVPFAGSFVIRKDYSESIDNFYKEKDKLEQDYNSAKLKGQPSNELADRFHTFQEYAELMQAIRAPIGEEHDRDKRFEYEKYVIGLSRAALGKETLDRYPNPLTASAETMPPEIAKARKDYVGRLAKRQQLNAPSRRLGEPLTKFRERQADFQALRRRSKLPVTGHGRSTLNRP